MVLIPAQGFTTLPTGFRFSVFWFEGLRDFKGSSETLLLLFTSLPLTPTPTNTPACACSGMLEDACVCSDANSRIISLLSFCHLALAAIVALSERIWLSFS